MLFFTEQFPDFLYPSNQQNISDLKSHCHFSRLLFYARKMLSVCAFVSSSVETPREVFLRFSAFLKGGKSCRANFETRASRNNETF